MFGIDRGQSCSLRCLQPAYALFICFSSAVVKAGPPHLPRCPPDPGPGMPPPPPPEHGQPVTSPSLPLASRPALLPTPSSLSPYPSLTLSHSVPARAARYRPVPGPGGPGRKQHAPLSAGPSGCRPRVTAEAGVLPSNRSDAPHRPPAPQSLRLFGHALLSESALGPRRLPVPPARERARSRLRTSAHVRVGPAGPGLLPFITARSAGAERGHGGGSGPGPARLSRSGRWARSVSS